VERAGEHLAWRDRRTVARRHAGGVSLAIVAPVDQLLLATEVNEWALCAALVERDPLHWNGLEELLRAEAWRAAEAAGAGADPAVHVAPVIEEAAAMARFRRLAQRESNPRLRALLEAAAARGLPPIVDESELSLGAGRGSRIFPLAALPEVQAVPWAALNDIPTAIVTGSNGKTTTVRLLAACTGAHGWRTAYNCTDGVFLDDELLVAGDYSGPAGTRRVLRERRAEAAILETARGGILRRGIAASSADTAVITNVSADHFGEYGIDDLEGLAAVKFSVAGAVKAHGLLVLNADDAELCAQAETLEPRFGRTVPLGWFAADDAAPRLREHRARGGATCGVREGRLSLSRGGVLHDLGAIAGMPLAMDGIAAYNVANLAGAALAAISLGVPAATIARVFARFGADPRDNPGRLMRFDVNGVKILIDYAHNPDGLRGFLEVARHLRGPGRLGLLLGQAGNRKDADIEELARVAARFEPDLVVVKEDEAHLRGRSAAEVPRIIRAELLRLGLAESALPVTNNELEAVRLALGWARPGDVLALPIHSSDARATVLAMLQAPPR
jgi:UDP-N-acetylmuramyl tripeptide synthase